MLTDPTSTSDSTRTGVAVKGYFALMFIKVLTGTCAKGNPNRLRTKVRFKSESPTGKRYAY